MKKKELRKMLAYSAANTVDLEERIEGFALQLEVIRKQRDFALDLQNVAEAKLASIRTHIEAEKEAGFPAENTLSVVESIL